MKSLCKSIIRSSLIIGISAGFAVTAFAEEPATAGVVRISKPKAKAREIIRGQSEMLPSPVLQASSQLMNSGCNTTNGCNTSGAAKGAVTSGPITMGAGNVVTTCPGNGECSTGQSRYRRNDWRSSDWYADDSWGSGLHRRTQRHSLGMEQAYYGTSGRGPSMYYRDSSGQDMVDYFRCKFGYFIPTGGGGAGVPWVGHYSRVYPVNPQYGDQRDGQIWAAQGYGVPIAVPLAPVVGHTYNYGWGIPSSRLTPISHPAY